jgi:hydrogenase expression/formation protein HypC
MCIGVPMVVEGIDGAIATCVARGCRREVSLLLLGEDAVEQGGHVLVHRNLAMEVMTPEYARLVWEALDAAFDPSADGAATSTDSEESPC